MSRGRFTSSSRPGLRGERLVSGMSVLSLIVWGECRTLGSQLELCRMSFPRSAHSSDITQNSLGHGEPPKVSLRLIRAMSPLTMVHRGAVSLLSVTRL